MHLLTRRSNYAIQNAGFELLRHPPYSPFARQMASWKTKDNISSTTESELWRNAGPSAFYLQETMLKSN